MWNRICSTVLCCIVSISVLAKNDELSAQDDGGGYEDVGALLEAGRERRSLPRNVVIRLHADLGRDAPLKRLVENWELTCDQIHRLRIKPAEGTRIEYQKVESIAKDSKGVCQDLLDGKIDVIALGEGEGKARHFVGTDYEVGHRSIEILIDGKRVLEVGESCVFAGLPETDARAFAALYERLARRARSAFDKCR